MTIFRGEEKYKQRMTVGEKKSWEHETCHQWAQTLDLGKWNGTKKNTSAKRSPFKQGSANNGEKRGSKCKGKILHHIPGARKKEIFEFRAKENGGHVHSKNRNAEKILSEKQETRWWNNEEKRKDRQKWRREEKRHTSRAADNLSSKQKQNKTKGEIEQ